MMSRFEWTASVTCALVAGMAVAASPAWSQSPCAEVAAGDSDADGFDDLTECGGIQLLAGLKFVDSAGILRDSVPGCFGTDLAPEDCLDHTRQDLFVIVVPSNPSGLPDDNILSFTTKPAAEGGLDVSVHVLNAMDPLGDRTVSSISTQKAVRITESRDAPGDKFGLANYGSPNGLDGSTIWTRRMEEFVAAECATTLCETDKGDSGVEQVTAALISWVLNHEVGHLFALTATYNSRFGGYHLKAGEDEVMTQFIGFNTTKKSPKTTTFFIPESYSDRSRADKLLR